MKTILKVNLIISIILTILGRILFVYSNGEELVAKSILASVAMCILFFAGLNIPFLPYYIYTTVKKIINKQYIDTKETIYTRELPKEYNSVIAGELLDFKSNFKGEYVAGTIGLINRGYIIEENGNLSVNKEKSTEGLLKNEKYILDTCTQINTKSYLSYSLSFFEKIKEDMFDLGLYRKNMLFKIREKIKSKPVYLLLTIIASIYFVPAMVFLLMMSFWITGGAAILVFIAMGIWFRKRKLTSKGENEKEKITKLKLYFDKETSFSEKTDIERKIWGEYSAFAIALESNKKMQEEIFDKYFKYRE